jgi:hypothetical protein
MSTVLEIESAIEQLPPREKWNLIHRLNDALWQDWDKQIESDAAAGRLDHLVQEVEADIAAELTPANAFDTNLILKCPAR